MTSKPIGKSFRFNIFLSFAIFLFAGFVNANEDKQQADRLSALPQSCYIAGKYAQTKSLKGLNKPLKSLGSFIFSCDKGLIWHTETPVVETIVYSSKGKHTQILEDNTTHLLKGKLHRHLGKLLTNLIGANTHYIEKYFEAESLTDTTRLTPKKTRMKKFIDTIELAKNEDSANITLHHSAKQKTDIHVFEVRDFTSLNLEACKENFLTQHKACEVLFL